MSFRDRSQAYLRELSQLFKFLSRHPSVLNAYPCISASAGKVRNKIIQAQNFPDRPLTIAIAPNWKIPLNPQDVCSVEGEARLFIGGEMFFREGCLHRQALSAVITFKVSDSAVLTEHDPPLQPGYTYAVRKIHYDFDRELTDLDRPIQHLQVGGKLNPEHLYEEQSVPETFEPEWFTQLDLPRIPYPVTDFATLLEMLLKQFNREQAAFLGESGWIERVCSMEKIWLKHYYENALELIDRADRRETLYTHQCMPVAE